MPQTPTSVSESVAANSPQQRVQIFAKEMEQLASSGLPPQQFFSQFLDKLVTAVSAQAGAVWLLDDGRFQLSCDVRLLSTGIQESVVTRSFHQLLLSEVASNGQARTAHTDRRINGSEPAGGQVEIMGSNTFKTDRRGSDARKSQHRADAAGRERKAPLQTSPTQSRSGSLGLPYDSTT